MTAMRPAEDRRTHPWPGLAAYGPEDAASFFGREDEVRTLAQLIAESVQVTVFGPSGTGKTSMIRAGVLPQLADRDFLGVYIRLDHSPTAPAYAVQVRQALDAQLKAAGVEVEATCELSPPDRQETLWEHLHRCEFWSARNRLVRPVLVFDQFEEVFTLGQTAPNAQDLVAQLGDLCSNSVPRQVEALLARSGQRLGYPIDSQNYRVVLCLREDFLARLEEIAVNVPALRRNRFGIRAMTGLQALQAVLGPGRDLLDDLVARQIVTTVGGSRSTGAAPDDEGLRSLSVEPALLSLFCRELNSRRLARGDARITLEHVSQSGSGILKSFYAGAMTGVAPATRAFVEDRLLTTSGFRSAVAVEDVAALGVSDSEIRSLVDQRILRFDERQGVRWVEFTHDILTGVARESRQRRLQEQREAGIRRQARRRTRLSVLIAVAATLIVAAVVGSWWLEYHRNRQEIVTYYNNWAKRNGLPEGVGELTAEQVKHRAVSFKMVRYGSINPVTQMLAVDSHGDPTPKNGVKSYLSGTDDSFWASPSHECQWEFILDPSGKHPVYEKASDRSGKLVWGLIYSPVRNGNKVKASFVGRDGFPQANAQNGWVAEYVEIEYGPDGLEHQHLYMDRRGRAMPGPDRAFGKLAEYDPRGLPVYVASLGPPDEAGNHRKVIDNKGGCALKAEYDTLGNGTTVRTLDTLDNPTIGNEGAAGTQFEYDQYDRLTRLEYVDTHGTPCLQKNGYAIVRMKYDERGNRVEWACFDTQDRPTLDTSVGDQKLATTFDERGNVIEERYFGTDGRPCQVKDGYAIVRMKYDERGEETEWACFDAGDRPILDKPNNIHKLVQSYDGQGNIVETRYFGVDDQPSPHRDGYAIARSKYDEQGNRIEWACFDTRDKPTLDTSSASHRTIQAYDQRGKLIETTYVGVDGLPCAQKDGYAIVRLKYNEHGDQIEWACFDTQGQPALDKTTGNHRTLFSFDEQGRTTEIKYLDVDGQPCLLPDGYATMHLKHDPRGKLTEVRYFGIDGHPCRHKDGNYGWSADLDERGHQTRFTFLGIDGKPAPQVDGYAITHMKYDERGNQVEWACFDSQDRPAMSKSAEDHRNVQTYDQRGKVIEVRYFGIDGMPCMVHNGFAIVRNKYDERGNQLERACFDIHDHPALDMSVGCCKTVQAYDAQDRLVEIAYFGVDGQPIAPSDGCAIVRMKYDPRGNQIERACFDTRGQPAVDTSVGSHKTVRAYDDHGRSIESKFFGVDGRPCLVSNGFAIVRLTHDPRGNLAEARSFGVDGQPCTVAEGYAIVRMKYDERGNQIERACFDTQDRPALDTSLGSHKTVQSYDLHGRITETRYFGVDGLPCIVSGGYAIVRMKYDERGNPIERSFFDTLDRPIQMRLVVTQVVPGGTGNHVGLEVGDVLWQYTGQDVHDMGELFRLTRSPGTASRKLVVHRNGRPLDFDVPPGLLGLLLAPRPESAESTLGPAPATQPSTQETRPE